MSTYYCAECDWFNQIMGMSGMGGSKAAQWHLNKQHTVFTLPEIKEKEWNKMHILDKLNLMLEGHQMKNPELSEWEEKEMGWEKKQGEAPETCIHDWRFEYVDVLRQLKTSQKELIRSECRKCDTSRLQGPADKVKDVFDGPGRVEINGHCDIVAHGRVSVVVRGGKVNIVEESDFTDLILKEGELNFEADVKLENLDVRKDATSNAHTNTITIKNQFLNGGTINV